MKVLVINSGSSSLKFGLFDVLSSQRDSPPLRLGHGQVSPIGHGAILEIVGSTGAPSRRAAGVKTHKDAVRLALDALQEVSPDNSVLDVQAVGHRVVHGAGKFRSPTLIDDAVLSVLEGLSDLAPLHNPAAIEGIKASREVLGPGVPMVAVFDTAFHATLPEHAYTYALPRELASRHEIRRYGFHGTAHEYMLKRYAGMAGISPGEATIITLQLGNGCSATAIREGRSVDTSMGFTPLEGLVMGTRSGDIDPSIMSYLVDKEGTSADEVERMLNERSGMLGISGRSGDMRDLLSAAEHDAGAALAIEVFCYRVQKYIGAYLAAISGASAVVFGGGIGENSPAVRARICKGFEWCGLRLDPARNEAARGAEGRISADGASISAYVVTVDEDSLIATHTAERIVNS